MSNRKLVTDEEIIEIVNDPSFPTRDDQADALGIAKKTLFNRLWKMKKEVAETEPDDFEEEEEYEQGDFFSNLAQDDGLDHDKIAAYYEKLSKKVKAGKLKKIVITSAQNNTGVFQEGWETLLNYVKVNKADLVVVPVKYKNPNAFLTHDDYHVWWPEEVEGYLLEKELDLHPDLKLMSHFRINATASIPLTGCDSVTDTSSGIFGHAQVQLKYIPVPQFRLPKAIMTSGSISVKNYSSSKMGEVAKFNHSFGAVVVEFDSDGDFHFRQLLMMDDGSFCDIDTEYYGKRTKKIDSIKALIPGDEHAIHIDPLVKAATFTAKDSINHTLKPKYIVRHDVHDCYSGSHWHFKDPVKQLQKYLTGQNLIREELIETCSHIDETTEPYNENLLVGSNHVEHLQRWLNEVNWKNDPANAAIYHWLWYHITERILENPDWRVTPDPFQIWCEYNLSCYNDTKFLDRSSGFLIGDIDVSQHGDKGANGARGTINAFAKASYKTVIGHSHTPGILKGCYQVGSCLADADYSSSGLSSWMNTHAIIYPNGKRALLNVINGKWRG